MSTFTDFMGVLGREIESVTDAQDLLAHASGRLDSGFARLALAVDRSSGSPLNTSVYALRAALQRLAEAHGHVTEALRELDVYVSAIGGHGVHPSRDVIADLAPDPGHRPRLSEIVHELIEGLDRPGSGQTVGALADRESGRPISHRLFSGRDGPAGTGGTVRDDLPGHPPVHLLTSTTDHVESHAAVHLGHPSSPAEAVLVITRPMCPGCERNLRHLIPSGKRIQVVEAVKGHPVRYRETIVGTGEYLKS